MRRAILLLLVFGYLPGFAGSVERERFPEYLADAELVRGEDVRSGTFCEAQQYILHDVYCLRFSQFGDGNAEIAYMANSMLGKVADAIMAARGEWSETATFDQDRMSWSFPDNRWGIDIDVRFKFYRNAEGKTYVVLKEGTSPDLKLLFRIVNKDGRNVREM